MFELPKLCTENSPRFSLSSARAHAVEVGRVRVGDLDHRAAAEVDAEVEAARREEDHGEQERDQRDDVEHQRVPHERDVAA